MGFRILVINPGSVSTKIAYFEDERKVWEEKLHHPIEELRKYSKLIEQLPMRKEIIIESMHRHGLREVELSAIAARGGLLKPLISGVYRVNRRMLDDLSSMKYGAHASNLGAILGVEIGQPYNVPVYIVDPVVVDEMEPIAKVSGLPEIERKSIFHALNQKYVAHIAAEELGKHYEECAFIVAHMGGGISVGVHKDGRVVDVNNALNGEGPFTPERTGTLPVWQLIELVLSGKYTREQLWKKIVGQGGMVAYLGTNDLREVKRRIEAGDNEAKLIYEAMAYQIAKEIAAGAAVLKGKIDAIILTGGLANEQDFVDLIKERVDFLAPVKVYPGEREMEALAYGVLRVLRGEIDAHEYS
ncbi:butyrate kinase [candidate division WOR-3 bacterium]|nr:butyrate kinase [candidate division WOR-3 bacterium]